MYLYKRRGRPRVCPACYENIILDEYIIMPNHMHGILIIDRSTDAAEGENNRGGRADARPAPTLGDIVGSFKSRCVDDNLKRIKKEDLNEIGKIWQQNYYERMIQSHPAHGHHGNPVSGSDRKSKCKKGDRFVFP